MILSIIFSKFSLILDQNCSFHSKILQYEISTIRNLHFLSVLSKIHIMYSLQMLLHIVPKDSTYKASP